MRATPLIGLIRKEFIQFFHTRALVVLFVYVIAAEIAICAYAITYDVTHIPVAVLDLDATATSRALIDDIRAGRYFDPVRQVGSDASLERQLGSGVATLGVVVPRGFAKDLARGQPVSLQLRVDGSNANSGLIAIRYARRLIARFEGDLRIARMPGAYADRNALPRIDARARVWYGPGLNSRHFVVVAMLVLGVTLTGILHPAAALAREKEVGTLEQLLVMPFRTWELMAGKVVPTFVVSLVALALALWVPWWFDVPVRGSLPLFFALSALFLVSAMGLGLLFGVLARNLQQALMLGFFAIFPLFVISGTLVPVDNMPRAIAWLSYLSPVRHYLEIGLGIFLKGVGLETLWPQVLALAALGAAFLGAGLWRFGQQLR